MSKPFNDIYNEILSKYGSEIKDIQNINIAKAKVAFVIYCVLLLLLILAKAYFLILHFSIFYIVISVIVIRLVSGKKGNDIYKTGVINTLVKEIYPYSSYDYTRGIASSQYNKKAFRDNYDRYSSEDLVVTNNALNLIFSEVHTEVESTDEDGNTTYSTSFLGIAGFCDLNKTLNTYIYITCNRIFSRHSKNNLQVDMPEFEKNFDVFAENKITAIGLLTADVMTELLVMKKDIGSAFELAIEGNKIYFRLHTGNSFEMSFFKDNMKAEQIKRYYDLLRHVDSLTKVINKHISELEI